MFFSPFGGVNYFLALGKKMSPFPILFKISAHGSCFLFPKQFQLFVVCLSALDD